MFDPNATVAGYDFSSDYACMRFGGAWEATRGAPLSVPAPGSTGVPAREQTGEIPYTPAQALGLDDARVGYNILLFPASRSARVLSAALTGPQGAEDVRVLQPGDPSPTGQPHSLGTFAVPAAPMLADAAYRLDVVWSDGQVQAIPFQTVGRDTDLTVDLADRPSGASATAEANSLKGARLQITGPGGRPAGASVANHGTLLSRTLHPAAPGRYTACATAGCGRTDYRTARVCDSAKLRGVHRIRMRRVHRGVQVTASRAARGMRMTLQFTKPSRLGNLITVTRRVRLRASVRVRVPRGRYNLVFYKLGVKRARAGSYWPVADSVGFRYKR
jgi:hypothetical protein